MKRYLALVFCITMVLVMCTQEENGGAYDYTITRTETRSWPAFNIIQVNATTVNGSIDVTAVNDTLITAEIARSCRGTDSVDAETHIDDIVVTDNVQEGQLFLNADMPDDTLRNYVASFDITTPSTPYFTIISVNGDVTMQDMTGGAIVRLTNGGIATANLLGGFDAVTVNGTINCDMAGLGTGESAELTTTNGDVNLMLPADVSATFDASTTNGEVVVTGFSAPITYTINQTHHKVGTIGTGDGSIEITITNGDATIMAR